jgi:hypothetical protein
MREYTNKLIELVEDGMVAKEELILDLLNYLSESEVKDFMDRSGYTEFLELDDE